MHDRSFIDHVIVHCCANTPSEIDECWQEVVAKRGRHDHGHIVPEVVKTQMLVWQDHDLRVIVFVDTEAAIRAVEPAVWDDIA